MLQAWALEQEQGSRRKFREQNVLVPWQLQNHFTLKTDTTTSSTSISTETSPQPETSRNLVYQRFCHVYCEGELESLASRFDINIFNITLYYLLQFIYFGFIEFLDVV